MPGFQKVFRFTLAGALYLFSVAYSPWDSAISVALFLLVPLALICFPARINRATVNVTNPKGEPSSWLGGDYFRDVPTPGWLLSSIGWIILVGYSAYVIYRL